MGLYKLYMIDPNNFAFLQTLAQRRKNTMEFGQYNHNHSITYKHALVWNL